MYIEQNVIRAGLAKRAADYPFYEVWEDMEREYSPGNKGQTTIPEWHKKTPICKETGVQNI